MMSDSVSELMLLFRCECGMKSGSICELLHDQEERRRRMRHHCLAALVVLIEVSIILVVTRI